MTLGLSSVPPPTGLVWQKPPWSRSPLYDRDPFRNTGEHIRDRTRAMENGGEIESPRGQVTEARKGPSTYNLKVPEGGAITKKYIKKGAAETPAKLQTARTHKAHPEGAPG